MFSSHWSVYLQCHGWLFYVTGKLWDHFMNYLWYWVLYTCITMLAFTKKHIVIMWYFLIFSSSVQGKSSENKKRVLKSSIYYMALPILYGYNNTNFILILTSIRQFWINSLIMYKFMLTTSYSEHSITVIILINEMIICSSQMYFSAHRSLP